MTKIKICGLSRPCDIAFVNRAKPDYAGFVIDVPSSRRSVSSVTLRALRKTLAPDILPVGVFVNAPVEQVAALLNDGTLSMAQLHGKEEEGYLEKLRQCTTKPVLQAFQVQTFADVNRAVSSSADAILLDSGQGSGMVLDWSLLQEVSRPYFLAGGLGPHNLQQVLETLHPFAVDMSSGVETNGWKDETKMCAAVELVRQWNG